MQMQILILLSMWTSR